MLLKFIFFVQPTAPPIHQFLGKLWKISILGVLDGSLLFNEMTHQSFWNFHGPSFTHIFLLSDQDIQRSSLLNSPFVSITDSTSSQYLSILSATWIYPAIYIYGSVSRVATPPPPPWYGSPPLPPYLIHFAHATVAKLTFPYFCMHAAVAKRTFSFCWMNPLAGFGGSIARNCGEMQILSSRNGSAQCTGHFNAQQMESYTYTYPCTYIFININSYICKNIYI